ncbi:alpha/beta hydrolase [Mesobacillus subterraneus]|uniref:Alpha/beta hydrolase n=1 Tax=Mesobacillus subterraneus TaxID=285983 RepID=A0A427TM36_9BACI|nr:alpha/beta hydrolase-fold protein [Mesobacillus subterraneus]RSD25415.1 alpha/beta hydrolase [Mesobacillus subterraneus]
MFEHFSVKMTTLDRERTIRVYLPESYHEHPNKRYPVLFMHDGQNLYKDEDAGYGMSWGISDYLEESGLELIVVGIDCNDGYKRLDEYSPWASSEMRNIFAPELDGIGGEGKDYIEFVVHELKPLIHQKYRTRPDETAMAGSSMGGLISTYAACIYPGIFKKVASVSSAYWFAQEEIAQLIKECDLSAVEKFYLDAGTNESSGTIDSERYIESGKAVFSLLKEKVKDVEFVVAEGAVHNELAWRKRVPAIFKYLYG